MTLVTTLLTVALLYSISNLKELWVALFVAFAVGLLFAKKLISACCYEDFEKQDLDQRTIFQFLDFALMTCVFIISKILIDIFSFLAAITVLEWYDFINIIAIIFFFVFVILFKLGQTQ